MIGRNALNLWLFSLKQGKKGKIIAIPYKAIQAKTGELPMAIKKSKSDLIRKKVISVMSGSSPKLASKKGAGTNDTHGSN